MRHESAIITLDGQEVFPLKECDTVYIEKAPRSALLIGCDTDVVYTALRSKLNWSGAPVLSDSGGSNA
jgi:NAD+ kinase